MANAIRALSIDAVQKANSGHPGMPMGMADVMTMLYSEFLNFYPKDPAWPNRDRLILSAGHGSMLLYSLLYLTGYDSPSLEDIKNFRQLHAKTAGHPEYGMIDAIETSTGPLGQGIANAVGMAISEKKLATKFGENHISYHTYVVCGDGCLMEGISHEAMSLAGHLKLNKLIVIHDDNQISIDGPTNLTITDNYKERFLSYNWNYIEINGHDYAAIRAALFKAKRSDKPTLIAARTKIGFGSPSKEGTEKCHGAPLGSDEVKLTKQKLGLTADEFFVSEEVMNLWRSRYQRCESAYQAWQNNVDVTLNDFLTKKSFAGLTGKLEDLKDKYYVQTKPEASRKTSGFVVEFLNAHSEQIIGGSADLSGSNNTLSAQMGIITHDNFKGNYLYYGVREHAMVAIMNGLALSKAYLPYGGTFLVFSDYCRPSIRLAALMKQQIILVMTHDSIGLGEDGPTHQPVEHLASLRAIPNLYVLRPADAIETIECWQIALTLSASPSVLSLSRQDLSRLREENSSENLSAKGAYIIKDSSQPLVTIIATGSEVCIAIEASKKLEAENIATRVVSMPCMELFEEQDKNYKNTVIDKTSFKVVIEAACQFGWDRYLGEDGAFIGMSGFGESAPAEDLYNYFNITADAVIAKVKKGLNLRV
jgi:transketolase